MGWMEGDDDTVDAAAVSAWIGASERTVRDLAGRGIIVRVGLGRYSLRASVAGYIAHLREIAAGRGSATGPGALDLVSERARLAAAQADYQEMRNDQLEGSVVPVEEVARQIGEDYSRVRTRLLAIPSETAARVQRAKTAPEAEAIIREVLYEALEELSSSEDDGEPG
jgi:phage terminase Nu1 subunit (DNA packaging protein)